MAEESDSPPGSTPLNLSRDIGTIAQSEDESDACSDTLEARMSPSAAARLPAPGDRVGGKFLVESRIGSGGMGIVHQGEHLQLKTRIAIKFLRPELVADPAALSRFLQEARLAASIENEHSTMIHDVGTTDEGVPFIVMEFLRGTALDARLEQRGAFDVSDAVSIVLQALGVLAEAHSKGLVHRDLKPANLFLQERRDGAVWVKVMDFGISKSVGAQPGVTGGFGITAPRSLLGSPQYMSPEQLRDSSAVDHRSDIWSIGVVLYELLSGGKVPFDAPSLAGLCALILNTDPEPLRRFRGDVPPGLEKVIMRTLEKDPAERPQTVGELALLLAPYATESARASVGRINAACLKASRSRASTGAALVVEGPRPRASKPRLSPPLGLLLVAVVGGIAYVVAPRFVGKRAEAPETGASSLAPRGNDAAPTSAPSLVGDVIPEVSASAPTPASSAAAPDSVVAAPPRPPAPRPVSTRIRKPSEIKPVE